MLKEQFASQAHEQWAHWMKHLFKVSEENEDGSVTIPKELVDRWKRQMDTNFFLLSDQEQKSDYDQAEKFLKLLKFGDIYHEKNRYYGWYIRPNSRRTFNDSGSCLG